MTSEVGEGGAQKSRRKEHHQLICDSDKGGGGQKIRKFCGGHMWKTPYNFPQRQRRGVRSIRGFDMLGKMLPYDISRK